MSRANKKNKQCVCGAPSLKGLSQPVCAYAWARANWGEAWANTCYPAHPHARWEAKSIMDAWRASHGFPPKPEEGSAGGGYREQDIDYGWLGDGTKP